MRDIQKKCVRAIPVILGVWLGALVLYLAVQEREQAQAVPNLGILQGRLPDGTYESSHIVRLYLNLDTFNLNQHMVYGSAKVEIEPHTYDAKNQPIVSEGEPQKTYAISSVNLRLEHASKELGGLLWQGDSIEAIKLERSPHFGGILGKGNFEWNANPERSSFWYPFDQYTLLVNPTLVGQSAEGKLFEKIYGLEIESSLPNLRLEVVRHGFAPSTDPYEIRLRRPVALRVVAIAVLLLAIVWLIYLMGYADIDSYISQIITSFLALWGIRTTLQAGVSVFPMAMDYFVLVFAIIVVGFTVPSWLITHLLKRTKQCAFCKKEVSETATRCPFCTSHI